MALFRHGLLWASSKFHQHRVRNIIILASAVDGADKVLLPATFKAMSVEMGIGPSGLGTLSFAQTIAFAVALPLWGSMMRFYTARDLLVFACMMWGGTTILLALTTQYSLQIFLRLIVGAALASVNPLGQAMLCDLVPEAERGKVFGMQQAVTAGLSMTVSFGATSIAMKSVCGIPGWRFTYLMVAFASLATAYAVRAVVPSSGKPMRKTDGATWIAEQRRVVSAVASKPSFVIMVAQGVTGGIPWNAFAFLTFYYQLSGYTDFQAGQAVFWGGIGGVVGSLLGGHLGDWANKLIPQVGRCMVAQASVVLGIFAFIWIMNIPYGTNSFLVLVCAIFIFNAVACWTPPAALRPMCGELFDDPEERAQILSLWIALETAISSVAGAPLCGLLSEYFGYNLVANDGGSLEGDRSDSLVALRSALLGVSIVPWVLCALAWVPMYWTYPQDRAAAARTEKRAHAIIRDVP